MRYRLVAVVGLFAMVAAAFNPAAGAQDISIDTGGVAYGAEGEIIVIADQAVDASLVGQTCTGTVSVGNNESVHPNNDLIITSGDLSVTIPNVEEGANDISTGTGSVLLGETIRVELQFGADGVTSGGLTLTFDCSAPELPETEPEAPTPEEPDFTG